jgi:HAE1 family hydrophobic/amphiphilic exporter-1
VIVEANKAYQLRPENLSHIYLHSPATGKLVPFGAIAKWQEGVGPQNVPHYNQLPSATISFNLLPNIPLSTATKELKDAAKKILPIGVTGDFVGEADEFQRAIASLAVMMAIAIFIKYIILGMLYESYTHAMTIITTLPVATFGGLLTLWVPLVFARLLGLPPPQWTVMSLYGYIGIFMLLGIVAKNGIMMVDFANQNMIEGKTTFNAIYDACLVRFRPILMTGLAAIMGAMPIALGYGADGSSRQVLGILIVGGLAFSQVITLFITPAIFLYMQDFQSKFLNKYELFREEAARHEFEEPEGKGKKAAEK